MIDIYLIAKAIINNSYSLIIAKAIINNSCSLIIDRIHK